MTRKVLIAALPILILLAIPFLLRPRGTEADPASGEADKLVMITAHNESIRYEYEQAFRKYYRKRFGRDVTIDFRSPGRHQRHRALYRGPVRSGVPARI